VVCSAVCSVASPWLQSQEGPQVQEMQTQAVLQQFAVEMGWAIAGATIARIVHVAAILFASCAAMFFNYQCPF